MHCSKKQIMSHIKMTNKCDPNIDKFWYKQQSFNLRLIAFRLLIREKTWG